jgi:16S rRNA (uracil1498-N3)-methyltransferase
VSIRLHVSVPLVEGAQFELPEWAARHAQVRRVQPGDTVHLFDGRGSEHEARVLEMGRRAVVVRVGPPRPVLPELALQVTLAVGMPANERMDFLVEKATELGAAQIQPLQCARSVMRLDAERAQRRGVHWQAVAAAAAEQCGRAVVPALAPVSDFTAWCEALPRAAADGAILDGVVRTIPQAEGLEQMLESLDRSLDAVLIFDIASEELVRRLSGRTTCSLCQRPFFGREPGEACGCAEGGVLVRRKDDEPEAVRKRLDVYRAQTTPVIDWYRRNGARIVEINAVGTLDEVEARAMAGLGPAR